MNGNDVRPSHCDTWGSRRCSLVEGEVELDGWPIVSRMAADWGVAETSASSMALNKITATVGGA